MTKNITLSMPDEMAKEMEKMPEVNWSAVARKCIERYMERRQNPDISSLLEELQRQQGEDYVKGRRKAEQIANALGYRGVNMLLRKYHKQVREVDARSFLGPVEPGECIPSRNEIIEKLLAEKGIIKDASDEFLRGVRERLQEIEKALSKGP